jgi:hypothetical protein
MVQEAEEVVDLSPLTILFIASFICGILFLFIKRFLASVDSRTSKKKWKKRTREEEEAIIAAMRERDRAAAPRIEEEEEEHAAGHEQREVDAQQDAQNNEEEEKINEGADFSKIDEMTVLELKQLIESKGGMYEDCVEKEHLKDRAKDLLMHEVRQGNDDDDDDGRDSELGTEESLPDHRIGGMSKKEIRKVEKKKKKQEQQEAWHHMIEHQRRLRELREAEDREREEALREEEEERRRKHKGPDIQPEKPKIFTLSDEALLSFLKAYPSKTIPFDHIQKEFSRIPSSQLEKQIVKICEKNQQPVLLFSPKHERVRRVDQTDLENLRKLIRVDGCMALVDVVEKAFELQ